MTAPDYWEVGASGRSTHASAYGPFWSVATPTPDYWSSDAWVTADFLCEEVAPGAYL